jgi:uncharacterized lipoprotein YbaY
MLAFCTKSDIFFRKLLQVASKFSTLGPPHAVKVEIESEVRRAKLRSLNFFIRDYLSLPSSAVLHVELYYLP